MIHNENDTDGSSKAIHHTLGPTATQAAPGNHTHDGGNSVPIPEVLDLLARMTALEARVHNIDGL